MQNSTTCCHLAQIVVICVSTNLVEDMIRQRPPVVDVEASHPARKSNIRLLCTLGFVCTDFFYRCLWWASGATCVPHKNSTITRGTLKTLIKWPVGSIWPDFVPVKPENSQTSVLFSIFSFLFGSHKHCDWVGLRRDRLLWIGLPWKKTRRIDTVLPCPSVFLALPKSITSCLMQKSQRWMQKIM